MCDSSLDTPRFSSECDCVRDPEPPLITPTGSLLVAHPGLLDPNFRKSVIFISSASAKEGAFGLILNRPSGSTVADLLPERDDMQALGSVPVFLGGPVSHDQLIFASFHWNLETRRMECRHHVGTDEAEELLHDETAVIRAFIGYAGWSKGQLENELAQNAWFLKPADPAALEVERCPVIWRDLVGSFGPRYRLIADAPDDLSMN
jgi:putative transcriptional regulator